MSPLHPTKTMRRSALRRTSALASILALGFSGVTVLAGSPAQAADAAAPADVIMVQANIKTGMVLAKFQSDVREVLAPRPDFVTYNEVPLRKDGVLAPEGYDLFRTPGRYEGANPVVWRSDRWTPVATGTRRISNYREIPPKRHTMLGLRYANWVTLRSVDGRVASLVAAHVAPVVNGMPDLRRRTVKHIGALVTELKAQGPVFVGGDFNVHYRSSAYPRDVLTSDSMVPTYDALGDYFPTGDHHGATIDYVFNTSNDQIQAVDQRAVELNSDHDAVVAGLSWTVDAPAETTQLVNVPSGASVEQRLVVKHLLEAIRTTTAGQGVDLVTAHLELSRVARALEEAAQRGVSVRVVTRSLRLTDLEERLAATIGTSTGAGTGLRHCEQACRDAWDAAAGSRTMVLIRSTEGAATRRIDVNRRLRTSSITKLTTAVERVGRVGLAQGEDLMSRLESTP